MYTQRNQDGQKGNLGSSALHSDHAPSGSNNLVLTQLSQRAISGICRQRGCDDELQ